MRRYRKLFPLHPEFFAQFPERLLNLSFLCIGTTQAVLIEPVPERIGFNS